MNLSFEKLSLEHKYPVMEIYNYYIEHTFAAFPSKLQPENNITSLYNTLFVTYCILDSTYFLLQQNLYTKKITIVTDNNNKL